MSVQRIAARYAKSLVDLAKEQNALDEVHQDVQGFVEVAKNRDFELLLKSPIINSGKKLSIFKEVFGGKLNKITEGFFDIVIRKKREPMLMDIANSFVSQYKDLQKITDVEVISAAPIEKAGMKEIKAKLKESGISTKNIEVTTSIDESLIGGFIIIVGDKRIDASVANQLKLMSQSLVS